MAAEAAQAHEHTVIVNAQPKKVAAESLSYDDVVALAFANPPTGPNVVITVTWRHGNESGSLVKGESVDVKNGMRFDVSATGES